MNQAFDEYFNALRGKRCAVLGVGVSNRPLIRLLLSHGAKITACDRSVREKLDDEVLSLERCGAVLRLGENYLDSLEADVVFRTPGMRPDLPQITRCVKNGAVLTSEMEAFFEVCPCRIIAVTGSDGKTTTTTLISEMLKKAGYTVWLGGNIGQPLLPLAEKMQPEDFAVVEVSSFQLMTMRQSAQIAVVTNLAPNHLDMHKGMEEYVSAKENVYLHQNKDGVLIVNADNAITASFAEKAKGSVRKFSRRARAEAFSENGTIYCQDQKLIECKEIRIPGVHNVENYMAAILAVRDFVSDGDIRAVAREFSGVEHRIEAVRTLDGVTYYNDSIASSPSRTIAGLHSFDRKVILIAGGYDKHIPFDTLGVEICDHVRLLILCGDTEEKIKAAVLAAPKYRQGQPTILHAEDLHQAVMLAKDHAVSGDVVTLSPACAAFDRFKNFMERGKKFKEFVKAL